MTCEEARSLLGPFYDNEISDVLTSQRVAEHIETCEACAREFETLSSVSRAIKATPRRFKAPEGLLGRIEEATQTETAETFRKRITAPTPRWMFLFPFASGAGVAVVGMLLILLLRPQSHLTDELVADHVRSLQANHLYDVQSTDQHTVKPWFQGRIDFSPAVPDLTSKGFPLLGGRLDYLGKRPAAAIVYSRGRHTINVLVTKEGIAPIPSGAIDRDGFHLLAWRAGGLDYWAVSDVNPADLATFRTDFVELASAAPTAKE